MEKYNYIYHPKTNKKYKINSNNGKKILKKYISYLKSQKGGCSFVAKNNLNICSNTVDVSKYKTPCKSLPLDNFKKGGKRKLTTIKKRKNKKKSTIKKNK